MKIWLIVIFVLITLSIILFAIYLGACEDDWCFHYEWQRIKNTNSFGECLVRDYPVTNTIPRVCSAGDKEFVEGGRERENE